MNFSPLIVRYEMAKKSLEAELLQLGGILDAHQSVRKRIGLTSTQVPICDKMAFLPIRCDDAQDLKVELGQGYFASKSPPEAMKWIDRRITLLKEKQETIQANIGELDSKLKILESGMVGPDINEEGLEFVDICEEYHEQDANATNTDVKLHLIVDGSEVVAKKWELEPDEFDLKLLQKMGELELEEDEYNSDGSNMSADDDTSSSVYSVNGLTQRTTKNVSQSPMPTDVADAGEQKTANQEFAKSGENRGVATGIVAVKNTVIERFPEEADDSEGSDMEAMMFARQISVEYLNSRGKYLKANVIQDRRPLHPEDSDHEREHYE